jgi:hypothetical protein
MKPPLRTRRARGLPSRPERWSTPALRFYRFYRFGKHYRAGLQAPARVSKVRIQGSDVSDQRVDKAPAARPRKADEGCSVAATRERRPQLARQPVNLKHEGGRLVPRRATGPPHPPGMNRFAIGAAAAWLIRWVGPAPRKKTPGAGIAPLSRAAVVLQLVAPPACHPGLLEFRKSRWRGHLRGRAFNDT